MKLDQKAAIIGFLFGASILVVSPLFPSGIALGATITISCLTYLAATWRPKGHKQSLPDLSPEKKKIPLLISMIGATIVFCLWSLLFFQFSRPLEFFVFASIISAVISFEIGLLKRDGNRAELALVLVQILLLTTALSWSSLFAATSTVDIDNFADTFGVNFILNNGHIITTSDLLAKSFSNYNAYWSLGQYTSRPLMQIFASELQLLANFPSIKLAFAFSVSLSEIGSILFTFILTRRLLHDERQAAIATLLIGVCTWHLILGTAIIPMTMGLTLFTLLLSLMPFLWSSRLRIIDRRIFVLVLIVLTALVFTHTISSLMGLIVIGFAWLSEKISEKILRTEKIRPSSIPYQRILTIFLLLALVLLSAQWVFSGFLDNIIPSVISNTALKPVTPVFRNLAQFTLDNLGTDCLIFLAILGVLSWVERLYTGRTSFGIRFIIISASGFFFLTYGVGLVGSVALLPERWYSFLVIVIVPVAVAGYYFLSNLLNKHKQVILALFILVLTFAMIMSSSANIDTPLYYPSANIEKKSLTPSEFAAVSAAISFSNDTIYTDRNDGIAHASVMWSYLWSHQYNTEQIDFRNLNLTNVHGLVFARTNAFYAPVAPPSQLDQVNLIYSSGGAELFSKP